MSTGRLVTKSIRLAPKESETLTRISKDAGVSEAALMKRFVLDGISRHRLDEAIEAYRHGEADMSAAAYHAGVSVHRMMTELEARDIEAPAAARKLREGVETLIELFGGSDDLRLALEEFDHSSESDANP